jgi:diguanylate cyclase (GGDEF)-like protein
MRESINIDVLTNWVLMLRADVDGAVWLSDGDIEGRFYETISHDSSRIVPATDVALALLDSVEQRGVQGIVAVVHGVGTHKDAHNIFRPSQGDISSLLLMSTHGDKVIADICGSPWLSACEKEVGPIRNRVVRIASAIDQLRHACGRENSGAFRADAIHELVDWASFDLAWSHIGEILPAEATAPVQKTCVTDRDRSAADLMQQCRGADALGLFATATALYQPRGLKADRQVEASTLAGMLRVAFHPGDLERDEVFWKMKKWIRSNPKYPLLRRWRDLDPLGVLWDQRYWERDLSALFHGLEPGALLAVLKMDLDNFKSVNDQHGHAVGDEGLRLYFSTVQEVLGGVGEIYRRGGDEIIVLAPGLSEGTAREAAEQTRAKIETAFESWTHGRNLVTAPTASIGLTLAEPGGSVDEVVRSVDLALIHAKEHGKNRVAVK